MKSTPILGRGLGSLIPNAASAEKFAAPPKDVQRIPIDKISVNPRQPRSHFDHQQLEELIASVKEHGILQPLVLTKKATGYEIIAGERRFQASKIAGLKTVPAVVRDVSEQQQLELALVENLQRQDLNAIEEAIAYNQLASDFNMTQEEIAKKVGKSRSYVANTIRLLTLPEAVQRAIIERKITEGHAKVLLSLPTEQEQLALLERMLTQGLTVRAVEAFVRSKHPSKKSGVPAGTDAETAALEDRLKKLLGTKVHIDRRGKGGTIHIEYFSREELIALVEQLARQH